jgi:hypothetical protein
MDSLCQLAGGPFGTHEWYLPGDPTSNLDTPTRIEPAISCVKDWGRDWSVGSRRQVDHDAGASGGLRAFSRPTSAATDALNRAPFDAQ